MSKREEINTVMKEAMRNKDTVTLSTARLITAAMKDRDISARAKGQENGIDDAEILSMLQTMIKQRRESAKTYAEAGREDLAEREEQEITVIEQFLPKQLSEDEISAIIDQLIEKTGAQGMKDMGKIMGTLKSDYAGQIDMGAAGGILKKKLG